MCGLIGFSSKVEYRDPSILNHRGPDSLEIRSSDDYTFIFTRLAIMDLSARGNQPFENEDVIAMCNGEVYNYSLLKQKYPFNYKSNSDCEVILPLYKKLGREMCKELDSEFALVLFDKKRKSIFAARDPIGIRPLFYGYHNGKIAFSSEVKALLGYCEEIKAFPPGHYYFEGEFHRYCDIANTSKTHFDNEKEVLSKIRAYLIR